MTLQFLGNNQYRCTVCGCDHTFEQWFGVGCTNCAAKSGSKNTWGFIEEVLKHLEKKGIHHASTNSKSRRVD